MAYEYMYMSLDIGTMAVEVLQLKQCFQVKMVSLFRFNALATSSSCSYTCDIGEERTTH